jgi:hypothetical protein
MRAEMSEVGWREHEYIKDKTAVFPCSFGGVDIREISNWLPLTARLPRILIENKASLRHSERQISTDRWNV